MTTPATPRPLPFRFGERSLVDGIRLRWGGLGCVVLGGLIIGTGEVAGVIFGVLLIALGIATWFVTGFGGTNWHDLSDLGRYIAGTGAAVGFLFVAFFLLGTIAMAKLLQMIARMF